MLLLYSPWGPGVQGWGLGDMGLEFSKEGQLESFLIQTRAETDLEEFTIKIFITMYPSWSFKDLGELRGQGGQGY